MTTPKPTLENKNNWLPLLAVGQLGFQRIIGLCVDDMRWDWVLALTDMAIMQPAPGMLQVAPPLALPFDGVAPLNNLSGGELLFHVNQLGTEHYDFYTGLYLNVFDPSVVKKPPPGLKL